jgi:hypothetical protein
MKSKHKLLAAVTASGAVLCLSVSVDSHGAPQQNLAGRASSTEFLSLNVEQLKNKLRSSSPEFHKDHTGGRIDNIVQFFNFFNCLGPGWRNC